MWVQPAISAHIVLSSFKLNSSRFCVVGIEKQGIEGTGQKRDRSQFKIRDQGGRPSQI